MLYCDEVRKLLLKYSGYECSVCPAPAHQSCACQMLCTPYHKLPSTCACCSKHTYHHMSLTLVRTLM